MKKGDYEIKSTFKENNETKVNIQCCKCGNIRITTLFSFLHSKNNHDTFNCFSTIVNDRIGKIIEDFKIIKYIKPTSFLIKCEICGREKIKSIGDLNKKKGTQHQSCSEALNDHSIAFKKFKTCWSSMRKRTTNSNCKDSKYYLDKGITSDCYKNFVDFYDEQYLLFLSAYGKNPKITLDRINNLGNYTKDNIRWVSMKIQTRNRNTNKNIKAISPEGKEYTFNVIIDFAKQFNLNNVLIYQCLQKKREQYLGWKFCYITSIEQ